MPGRLIPPLQLLGTACPLSVPLCTTPRPRSEARPAGFEDSCRREHGDEVRTEILFPRNVREAQGATVARPKNPPFTLGKISFKQHPTNAGLIQARSTYNNDVGKRREITSSGKTEAQARRHLQQKVNEARQQYQGGDSSLRSASTLTQAASIWLAWKSREDLSSTTLRDYEGYVRRTIKDNAFGDLTVLQANDVGRVESWLEGIADTRGATAAKQARKVMSGILELSERRGAIPASVMHRVRTPGPKPDSVGDRKCTDEECDLDCGRRHLDTKRAFTPEEVSVVHEAADASQADIGDLAAFLFVTGARISEALQCTSWKDVDLTQGTVRIRGTKTAQADRTVALSTTLIERLSQRADLHGTKGLVFGITRYASKAGEPRDRNNVCKSLRRVFIKAEVPWAGTHTFRRTVATWMDQSGAPLSEIANQLGHANTNVTAGYLSRRVAPTRAADIMVLPPAQ